MPPLLRQLLAVRPVDPADKSGAGRLSQVLGLWSLTAIGLGATVGTGIFVLTGTVAAQHAGPAVTLSLLIAAFGSALAALCYAELATFLPVPGSAYSYTYATLGEGLAWFIGWNLLLEYAISASAVAVSWSGYVVNLLAEMHVHLPALLVNAPFEQNARGELVSSGAWVNLPAVLVVAAVLEARNPQRDLPLGILGALLVSTVLYVGMSAVMTGMVPYARLNVDQPVAVALDAHPGLSWLEVLVKAGIIIGMTSVILASLLGQPRILLSMADDGLLPPAMRKCHPRYKTPHVATAVTGVIAAGIAGAFPLAALADLISIGILLAFAVVCIGVLVMRRLRPDSPRPFRVPWAPFTCVLGALVCFAMMFALSNATWVRLLIWTVIGISIYAFYGYWHSRLRE